MLNIGNVGKLEENVVQNPVRWPNGSQFGVCLTHDVDRVEKSYQYITKSPRSQFFSSLAAYLSKTDEPYWQFEKIMDIENGYNLKSTFFFLNESLRFNPFSRKNWPHTLGRYDIQSKKVRDIIIKLDNGGWEIGLHGSIRSYNDRNLLYREKKIIEEILGHEIIGTRQHWLNLQIPQTWKLHQSLGLKYDCSFGLKYGIGYKEGIFHPFSPLKDDFLIFPLAIMDTFLFDLYPNYDDALRESLKVIECAKKNRGLLSILWHQRSFDETAFPFHSRLYQDLIEKCISDGAWFGTCEELYNYMEKI